MTRSENHGDGPVRDRDARPDDACCLVRELLPLFVGGDLDAASGERVRGHLRDCHPCRLAAGAQLQALRALRRTAVGVAVPGVDDGLFVRMHAGVVERVRSIGPVPQRRRLGRQSLIAAVACALFVGGWIWSLPTDGLLRRLPIRASEVSGPGGRGAPGGPAMQALSHERPAVGADFGLGLMGRLSLRTLEDQPVVLWRDLEDLGGPAIGDGLDGDAESRSGRGR